MSKEISLSDAFAQERAKRDALPPPSMDAVRITGTMNELLMENPDKVGWWCAFTLQDGVSDKKLYPLKTECIKAQGHNEARFIYMFMRPAFYDSREVQRVLEITRVAYVSGYRTVYDND